MKYTIQSIPKFTEIHKTHLQLGFPSNFQHGVSSLSKEYAHVSPAVDFPSLAFWVVMDIGMIRKKLV